jgi:hypothetical protein
MIYMKFTVSVRDRYPNLPEYACYRCRIVDAPLKTTHLADYVFEFFDEGTVYYKDRTGNNYQYTGEEKVVLALKAVLI